MTNVILLLSRVNMIPLKMMRIFPFNFFFTHFTFLSFKFAVNIVFSAFHISFLRNPNITCLTLISTMIIEFGLVFFSTMITLKHLCHNPPT
jgi:hypothetical protein